MKFLKRLLIILFVLVAIFLIVPFFLQSSYKIERTITINRPTEIVFKQVSDFDNYLKWNAWSLSDPKAKNTVSGEKGKVGSKWAWEGEVVGQGSLTIVEIKDNELIKNRLDFIKPFVSTAYDQWTFKSTPDGKTVIVWTNYGELPYFSARYAWLILGIEKDLKAQFDTGLSNLKLICEKTNAL